MKSSKKILSLLQELKKKDKDKSFFQQSMKNLQLDEGDLKDLTYFKKSERVSIKIPQFRS